jgi:outer membrane protein
MILRLTPLLLCLVPVFAHAAPCERAESRWLLATRLVLSGSSYESDPDGLTMYSGLSLEAAARRSFARHLAVELSLRTESREVDRDTGGVRPEPLGSVEVLPATVSVQYHPDLGHRLRPFVGAGASLAVAWEKSGFLDSADVDPHFGPALQIGVDAPLGAAAVLTADVRWNTFRATITREGADFAKVRVDPLTFGLGVGLPF